jgi:RNA-directed DNA polymerase
MRLLKMMLRVSGKKGVPQGGVISPLLSNLYLNQVDQMLERAIEVTRQGMTTHLEYARYADDLVILVDGHQDWDALLGQVHRRLLEELAKLQVTVNEDKTRIVNLAETTESFGFLGFDFRRVRSRRGRWYPRRTPKMAKRKALLRNLKVIFRSLRSQPVEWVVERINPILRGWVQYFAVGHASRCFGFVRRWVEQKIRRHMMRARKRAGFGWRRWRSEVLYSRLGLFSAYQVTWGIRTSPAPSVS